MSLTQEEFLTVINQTSPDVINIWYSTEEPLTVFGLTIPVIDNTGANNIQLLQTVQQINITLNGYNYTFTIISRVELTAVDGTTYYFFDIEDQVINPLADDTAILVNQVIFIIPGIQDIAFLGGEYDVLLNNVDINRTSTDIMVSDRYKTTGGPGSLNPLNIDVLRNLTAEKAQIQDSNYSVTGWINGRYQGTQTNSTEYGGIDSAVTGKAFQGSLYPLGVPNSVILQQSSGSITIYTDYLDSTNQDIPTAPTLVQTKYTTDVSVISETDTQIPIKVSSPPTDILPELQIGDIITINTPDPGGEYIRVTNIISNISNFTLIVTRGWNGSGFQSHSESNLVIRKVGRTGIPKIYKLQGNKIQGVQAGKLLIKDNQEILTIDVLGQVLP